MSTPSAVRYIGVDEAVGNYVYQFDIAGVPAYIGKGHGTRVRHHERAALHHKSKTRWQRTLKAKLVRGASVMVTILADDLSSEEANALEVLTVARLGRRDLGTGTLYNRTNGGDGLSSEDAQTLFARPDVRRKLARAKARRMRDPIERAKLSVAHRRAWADPAIRARRVAINREILARPEVRAKQAASIAVTNQTPETKAKRTAAAQALHRDPAYRLKLYTSLREAANRPERRAKSGEIIRKMNADPEFQRKRRAGIEAYWERERRAGRVKGGRRGAAGKSPGSTGKDVPSRT